MTSQGRKAGGDLWAQGWGEAWRRGGEERGVGKWRGGELRQVRRRVEQGAWGRLGHGARDTWGDTGGATRSGCNSRRAMRIIAGRWGGERRRCRTPSSPSHRPLSRRPLLLHPLRFVSAPVLFRLSSAAIADEAVPVSCTLCLLSRLSRSLFLTVLAFFLPSPPSSIPPFFLSSFSADSRHRSPLRRLDFSVQCGWHQRGWSRQPGLRAFRGAARPPLLRRVL